VVRPGVESGSFPFATSGPTSVLDSRIFISYRHADSAAYAGRLYDRLKDRYGHEQIFRDLEMDVGIDFVERLDDTVGSCVAMVVVIGPGWLDARDDAGNRRLDDPDDYVRVEVSGALRRSIRVIPVLVGDAKMPGRNDLPDALRALARRNALQLSDSRWDYDVGRLMDAVNKVLQEREEQLAAQAPPRDEPSNRVVTQPTRETPRPPRAPETPTRASVGVSRARAAEATVRSSPLSPALIAVVAAALAAVPAHDLFAGLPLPHEQPPQWNAVIPLATSGAGRWALIAAAVAVCVAVATRQRTPARALLTGLAVGAFVGALSGALDQVVTNLFARDVHKGHWHDAGILVSVTLLGGILGASGVTGPRGLTAAAGGLVGGALAALLAIKKVPGGLWLDAALIVAGIWTAELLRLRTERGKNPPAVAFGRGRSQFEVTGSEDEGFDRDRST
jgi:TIR domain